MSDFAVNPDFGLWQRNAVLNGFNSHYVTDEVEGTLSIKSMASGRGSWITRRGRYVLDAGAYLVLNRGQRYSVDIRSRELTETFCIFFRPGFLEEVKGSLVAQSLDQDPEISEEGFYERVSPADLHVTPALSNMRTAVRRGFTSELEADDLMIDLAAALLSVNHAARAESARLDFVAESTRVEMFRRLNRSRDFIMANLSQKCDLCEIASTACLSPFHFHRLFKLAYRQTPHEFLTSERLRRAKRLLATTDDPIQEVARSVGFEGAASFTKLFSRQERTTPVQFRKSNLTD